MENFDDRIVAILGDPTSADPDVVSGIAHPDYCSLKELWHDFYTQALEKSKLTAINKYSGPDEAIANPVAELDAAEMENPRLQFEATYNGLRVEEATEPCAAYWKVVRGMRLNHTLFHVPWKQITSQQWYVHKKSQKGFMVNDNITDDGRVKPQRLLIECPLDNPFQLQDMLTRRGIALHMEGLCDFKVHRKLADTFVKGIYNEIEDETLVPPTIEMAEKIDRQVWDFIGKKVRGNLNLRPGSNGLVRPVEEAMVEAMATASLWTGRTFLTNRFHFHVRDTYNISFGYAKRSRYLYFFVYMLVTTLVQRLVASWFDA